MVSHGCHAKPPESIPAKETARASIGWLQITEDNPAPKSLLALPPDERLRFVDAIYRPRPDRRFLYAVAEVTRLLSGKENGSISVGFEPDHRTWLIRFQARDVGRLPEIPTFEQSQVLLSSWADSEIAKHPIPQTPGRQNSELAAISKVIDGEAPENTIADLIRLNALWKKHPGDAESMRLACRGLIWLQVSSLDWLQLTDPLAGRALALMAIAKKVGKTEMPREEALLAAHMGYEAAARKIAEGLPETDPVRSFVGRDLTRLSQIAETSGDSQAQYFLLRRLAERSDAKVWTDSYSRSTWKADRSIASLSAVLSLHDFGTFFETATALAGKSLAEVSSSKFPEEERDMGAPDNAVGAHLAKFEQSLDARSRETGGGLLDRESIAAFYRANFYSSLYAQAWYFFDQLGSDRDAEQFGLSLVEPPPGTASELKQWILDRIAIRKGSPSGPPRVARGLATFRHLGLAALVRIRSSNLQYLISSLDSLQRRPMRGFFESLDTRPEDLLAAAYGARENLNDMVRMRRYLTAAVAFAPDLYGWNRVELLGRDADADGLQKIVDQPELSVESRNRALALLVGLKTLDAAFLDSKYRELIAANPMSPAALFGGMSALEARHELQKVDGLFTFWFDLRKDNHDLTWAAVTAAKSAFLRRTNRVNEAWSVIEPVIETWKQDCLAEAAEVLAAMGRLDEAREMAERAAKRYPGAADAPAQVSEMLWKQKKFVEAANVLQSSRAQIRAFEWRSSIAKRFVWGLTKASDAEIENAYSELSHRGFDPLRVAEVAKAIGNEGRHELAARLLSKMPVPPNYRLMLDLTIYEELVRATSARDADDWFRTRASASDPLAAATAFRDGHFDVLWSLSGGTNPDLLAVLRAASLIMARKENGERWTELRAYFQKSSSPDPLVFYGRYLTGTVGRDAILALGANTAKDCSLAWILGLDAVRHDRYEEASDWFQAAVEAGVPGGGRDLYAFPESYPLKVLQDWTQGDRFLTTLAPGTPLGVSRVATPPR